MWTRFSLLWAGLVAILWDSDQGVAAPNVVLIVADDLGWGDVSWHGGVARTPNLDQLRQEGIELNRYYAHATCTPTRVALYTGRNPYRFGIVGPIGPNEAGVSLDEHFLPETFQVAGYATHLVGKWHVGESNSAYFPTGRGFDHFFGFLGGSTDYYGSFKHGVRDGWLRDAAAVVTDLGYSTELFADEAEAILRNRDPAKPLFLTVCFNAPHTPLAAPPEIEATYPDLVGTARTYAAMIESMDTGIGRILAAIDAQGMRDSTLVVFVSDNGAALLDSPGSNGPLRMGKGSAYEGGIRVPALARWPGTLSAGVVVEQVVADLDWLPTLAAAAGIEIGTDVPIDGRDCWEELQNVATTTSRTVVFAAKKTTGYLTGLTKLVRDRTGNFQLYDLASDPGESHDLSNSQPGLVESMRAGYDRESARLRDDFPSNNGVRLINVPPGRGLAE